jgi:phosphoadenosine phosphosulfate reductase
MFEKDMRPELQKKIDFAIRLLKAYDNPEQPVEIAYSGGKDSDVILQLAKEAGINYRAIYKNTTIDPPGTIKHAQEMGAEIHHPREGKTFLHIIEESGLPGGTRRTCCDYLKEYKILDKCVQGIRRDESRKRSENYQEPSICRLYGSKENHVEVVLPILEWTAQDVAEFVEDRKIKCAPVYYDEQGKFHPERRLGCIGCVLKSRRQRREDFKKYPKLLRQIIRRLAVYRASHPESNVNTYFQDEYEQMYFDLFCGYLSKYKYKDGLFGKPDFKGFLEKQFNIKL